MFAENLNEVKSNSLTKWFLKSLEESAKCRQKNPCGQTDELKHLAYRQPDFFIVLLVPLLVDSLFSEEESDFQYCGSAAETTFKMMENFTGIVNQSEATTAVGQNISEAATTELVKSAKSISDNVFTHIYMYVAIILIPLGIILNSVSLTVFQKRKAFSTSIGNHLKCISVSDSIMLIQVLFANTDENWEEKLNFPNIYSLSNISCKIFTFVKVLGSLSAGLIMSSATIERFLAIAFPLKYRSWNTVRTSKIVLSVLIIFTLGISAFLPMFMHEKKQKCVIIEKYRETADLLYTIFILGIANGMCGAVILVFTIIIIALLFHQSRKRNVLSNNNASPKSKKEVQISAMLVTISLIFIFLRFPRVIILRFILANSGDPLLIQSLDKLTTIFIVVNRSVNFVVYMIFLESFRKTFFEMFSCFIVRIMECLYKCKGENQNEAWDHFNEWSTVDHIQVFRKLSKLTILAILSLLCFSLGTIILCDILGFQ